MNFYDKITPPTSTTKLFLDFILSDTDSKGLFAPNEKISRTSWTYDGVSNSQVKIEKLFKKCFSFPHELTAVWYQVYAKHTNSYHGFHHHCNDNCDRSGIFYIKLTDRKLLTQFKYDDMIVTPDAQEGDIILFDSSILHQSPPNDTDEDKIIVSFNFNTSNERTDSPSS